MNLAILLICVGALARLVPHPPNAVAMGTLALFAGARLPKRWALAVPLGAMALSDLVIDYGRGRSLLSLTRLAIYLTLALVVLLGRLPRSNTTPAVRAIMAVMAATLFFLTTNFAVWLSGDLYPQTFAGLAACYVAAVPFYGNSLLAELAGTGALFGVDALAHRLAERKAWLAALVGKT